MPELTREEKLKLVEKLPQKLQDFLYSEDTGAFLLYLGNKYKLPDEKISALSKIVADIILKITPITSLAQEIANKVIPDPQIAMIIAQELNSELLAPVLMPTPVMTPAPAPLPTPIPAPDQYREPASGAPEIVDLRKTPPPPMPMPVAVAPAYIPPPRPLTFTKPVEPPVKIEPIKPTPSTPLIEAEPHKVAPPLVTSPQPLAPEIKAPEMPWPPVVSQFEPQFIIRPPGLAPTPTFKVGAPIPVERGVGADLPHDILDLRKDKGEF